MNILNKIFGKDNAEPMTREEMERAGFSTFPVSSFEPNSFDMDSDVEDLRRELNSISKVFEDAEIEEGSFNLSDDEVLKLYDRAVKAHLIASRLHWKKNLHITEALFNEAQGKLQVLSEMATIIRNTNDA